MDENIGISELVRLMQQIELENEAAQHGLSGLASGTARHAFITAREQRIHAFHQQLIDLVGPDQAIKVVAETIWSPADRRVS
ncbi:MAG TPA: hypothetical protein VK140_03900 [Ktedonobacteraceae bacterium]|nr:hypothetical protein [Ktedonobacteraceae bacterium]